MVKPLYEGTFSVGLDKKFKSIGKNESPEKGALKLSINPFLIKGEKRNYLIDAGLGDFGEDTTTQMILNNLDKEGLTEFDITDIFLSHLHYDHLGGLAGREQGYWDLTFPDAKIWTSRGGWEKAIKDNSNSDDELNSEFIHFLDARADIHFLNDEDEPYPDIRIKRIGGHTEFSLVIFYTFENQSYMMAGDVIGTKSKINHKYAAKYDYDPKHSMKVREDLKKIAFEQEHIILAYHETDHPMFQLTDYEEKKGYLIRNIESE